MTGGGAWTDWLQAALNDLPRPDGWTFTVTGWSLHEGGCSDCTVVADSGPCPLPMPAPPTRPLITGHTHRAVLAGHIPYPDGPDGDALLLGWLVGFQDDAIGTVTALVQNTHRRAASVYN